MVQHRDARGGATGPVAVVGMGCRLPGEVDSPAALWRLLAEGRDAVGAPPPGRRELWLRDGSQDGRPEPGPPAWGGYLSDVTGFDADFFGVSGREADVLDPQHRLLLEVAWEALEHAGLPPDQLSGSRAAVFTGLSYNDYMDRLAGHPQELEGSILTNGHCVAAGRLSYLLGLHGPCLALDTACSSSLVALHLACRALLAGECDLALAGGVTVMLRPRIGQSFARMGMLSPTGRCHTFDASADGFVRGEGCGVVVLKRLADAIRDDDRVLAVVRGTAVNQDGRSDGLAAPSAAAQQALYREALERAGVDPGDVGLIEAHGTGTPVGDPVEFSSVAQVYGAGRGRCALGSVKTNLGHLEPAAGVTGLIKTVLCLRYGTIPPNLHFTRWNPEISAEGTRLFIPTGPTPWPVPTGPRLAAVSSFGFSGTNAHAVLEQPPAVPRRRGRLPRPRGATPPAPEVLLVPAGSAAVLPAAARRLAGWLEGDGAEASLRDVAHTLAVRRPAGRGRLAVLARSRTDAVDVLRSFAAGQAHPAAVSGAVGPEVSRRPVWVFSGQGSQWPGMARTLPAREPAFAAALAEADALIAAEAGFSVLEAVRGGEPVTGCGRVQPVLFALQTALAATWRAYGVEPAAVIGHSMGEVAAAVAAGALSLADGVKVICRRSALLTRIAGQGAMATVALDHASVRAELAAAGVQSVAVAVMAAPDSTVVAGDPAEVDRLVADWERRGVPAVPIAVDVASHCPQVDPLLADLHTALADLTPRQPSVPFYSTVLEDPHRLPGFDAAYWCANLRCPVRFGSAVAAAAADRHQVYVEVSPHPVVTHALTRNLSGLAVEPVVLPTLRRGDDEQTTFRTQLAALHCAGVTVDWTALYPAGRLVDAPATTFDRRRHWADLTPSPATAEPEAGALPGRHTEVPGQPVRHCWRADTGTAALPWLADHQVHGTPVLPGAASYAVALTAACQVFDAPPEQIEVTDVAFREMLRLAEHTDLSTTVTLHTPERAECEIFGRGDDGEWLRQSSAVLRRLAVPARSQTASIATLALRHPVALDPAALYRGLRSRGLTHGQAFTGLQDLHASRGGESFWARIAVPAAARTPGHTLRIHPVLVDLCLQLIVAGVAQDPGQGLVLPVRIRTARLLGDPATAAYGHARIAEATADGLVGHVRLLDEEGRPVLALDGVRFARRSATDDGGADQWLLELGWHPAARPGDTPGPARPAAPGSWLLLGEGDGAAQTLAAALRAQGAQAEVQDTVPGEERLDRLRTELAERLTAGGRPPHAVAVVCGPPGSAPQGGGTAALRRTRRLLAAAQAIAGSADPPRLYAVTRGARTASEGDHADPDQGALRGLVRVLALEHPDMRPTLVDADPADTGLHAVAQELLAGGPEDEIALRGPDRLVARLDYAPPVDRERAAAASRTVRHGVDGYRLRVGRLGDLGSLELAATGRRAPQPGEVELRILAAGVNFRDVLTAMGLLPGGDDIRYRIGFECAGVVTAVGPGVTHLGEGDTVLAVTLDGGAFGSFITVPAAMTAPIPRGADPVTAAGLPIAFLTAWYALRHVARLNPGERVLIHSASGGTGLAAIAVARRLGAQVLATAGSEEKRRCLRNMGIDHVMDSRSLDFAEQTRAATGGEGVDVVLNSLAGAAIRAGLETLRPFGRFVELGVRDILSDAPVGLAPFRHNITLSTVDLIELRRDRPETFAAALREVFAELGEGHLKPLFCTPQPLAEAGDVLRLMAGAGHIGKLVLTLPEQGEATAVLPDGPPVVRRGGAYVITGGLRGLGLAAARWLAQQGAGHLVLNGRTPPSPDAVRTIGELTARGTPVTVVLGDIAEPGTAERLVATAVQDGRQLRGVLHCAMVLEDAAVMNIRDDQLERVWTPKVTGAWQLHQAMARHRPDWLVLFSSMSSLLGNPGQGAYAAANAWLDAFAAWRSAQGLHTLAVDWGPWGETGVATDFAGRGYRTIPTDRGLQALRTLLAHRRIQTGVLPGEPDTWIPSAGRTSSLFGLLLSTGRPAPADGEPADRTAQDIRARLRALPPGLARRTALEEHLAAHVRAVLRLGGSTLDPQTPLRALGFDSLLAMELRGRLENDLGVRLAANFVWQHPTLSALAAGLADHMGLDLHDTGTSAGR